jgi:hypothetical protein
MLVGSHTNPYRSGIWLKEFQKLLLSRKRSFDVLIDSMGANDGEVERKKL